MNFDTVVELVQNMDGNYRLRVDDVYISPANIEKLPEMIDACDDIQSILITPFLISLTENKLYELHYYEFELEIVSLTHSHYIEYNQGNCLPKEIVENIKPKAVVAQKDKTFYITALNNYLTAISRMTFEDDRLSSSVLSDADLYFQIY